MHLKYSHACPVVLAEPKDLTDLVSRLCATLASEVKPAPPRPSPNARKTTYSLLAKLRTVGIVVPSLPGPGLSKDK